MAHCQIERAEIGPCQDSRGNCRVLAGARVERAASRPHGQQPRGAERRNETGPDPAAVSPPRTGAVRNVSASRAVTARPASPGGGGVTHARAGRGSVAALLCARGVPPPVPMPWLQVGPQDSPAPTRPCVHRLVDAAAGVIRVQGGA